MRTTLLILVLLITALPACSSEKHHDLQKSASIKTDTDALAASTPLTRSIPAVTADGRPASLDVYGNLQSPARLRLTIDFPDSRIVNNYYFLGGVLARATTQRYELVSLNNTFPHKFTPFYSYDVFFNNDQIIGRSTTGTPGNTAALEPTFPDRLLIDQLLNSTTSSRIKLPPATISPPPTIDSID